MLTTTYITILIGAQVAYTIFNHYEYIEPVVVTATNLPIENVIEEFVETPIKNTKGIFNIIQNTVSLIKNIYNYCFLFEAPVTTESILTKLPEISTIQTVDWPTKINDVITQHNHFFKNISIIIRDDSQLTPIIKYNPASLLVEILNFQHTTINKGVTIGVEKLQLGNSNLYFQLYNKPFRKEFDLNTIFSLFDRDKFIKNIPEGICQFITNLENYNKSHSIQIRIHSVESVQNVTDYKTLKIIKANNSYIYSNILSMDYQLLKEMLLNNHSSYKDNIKAMYDIHPTLILISEITSTYHELLQAIPQELITKNIEITSPSIKILLFEEYYNQLLMNNNTFINKMFEIIKSTKNEWSPFHEDWHEDILPQIHTQLEDFINCTVNNIVEKYNNIETQKIDLFLAKETFSTYPMSKISLKLF